MDFILAVTWYLCAIACIFLLCVSANRDRKWPFEDEGRIAYRGSFMEIVAYASAWLIVLSLVIAGLVDIWIWAGKYDVPSVSDLVHYTLFRYPWVGWIAAGICYHLLVDRPHVPWR